MSTGWTRVIEGYYKCPVQFAVTTSALTAAYSASLGGHPVTITLPSAAGTSMHHNDPAEPDWHYPERDNPLSRLPELAPYWGQVVVWANDHTTPKAVSVRRFRIATPTGSATAAARCPPTTSVDSSTAATPRPKSCCVT